MLTLFPSPAAQQPEPEPDPTPRRLQLLPLAMLSVAALLELFAWHRHSVGRAAPAPPAPSKISHGALPQAEALPSSLPELARGAQKAHQAKNRILERYVNLDYAISFSYPRSYGFKSPDEVAEEPNGLLQQRSDGSPSQQLLARIELPDNLYPRTDFLAGYLSLSVNPDFSADQCSQAIGVEEEGQQGTLMLDGVPFRSMYTSAATGGTHIYWHDYAGYSSGVCYEIELGVVTVNDGALAAVHEDRVFGRLDAILRTVKINHPI